MGRCVLPKRQRMRNKVDKGNKSNKKNNMEKINKTLFDKGQMDSFQLSYIYGGSCETICFSPTCTNNTEDDRKVTTDDCGNTTSDVTSYVK